MIPGPQHIEDRMNELLGAGRGNPFRALRVAVTEEAANRKAFDEIRARIGQEDVPIHVAADVEQIICETAGYFE